MSTAPPGDSEPPAALPRQASLRRLREFAIRPSRELGQNFLIDDNILAVIADSAALVPDDVVLEVGGGLGVLSEYLADRASYLHVIEIDRRLEPALLDAVGDRPNVGVRFADFISVALDQLDPPPTKLIANLPYGIAATAIIKALELPTVELVCAMTQREVADRIAAAPGGKLYGITSVIVQLSCAITTKRRLSRSIFHPAPNVDSSLLTLRRIAPPPDPAIVTLVHQSFAHRRKPLAGSVTLARDGGPAERDRVRAALDAIGADPNLRAERLTPGQFAALATELAR